MKVGTRSKVLIGIAAAVTGYVLTSYAARTAVNVHVLAAGGAIPGIGGVIGERQLAGAALSGSLQGRSIRAELARAVVNAGWDLNELRPVNLSLEDIFLQLTTAEQKDAGKETQGATA